MGIIWQCKSGLDVPIALKSIGGCAPMPRCGDGRHAGRWTLAAAVNGRASPPPSAEPSVSAIAPSALAGRPLGTPRAYRAAGTASAVCPRSGSRSKQHARSALRAAGGSSVRAYTPQHSVQAPHLCAALQRADCSPPCSCSPRLRRPPGAAAREPEPLRRGQNGLVAPQGAAG
jgi:hypothetical protein